MDNNLEQVTLNYNRSTRILTDGEGKEVYFYNAISVRDTDNVGSTQLPVTSSDLVLKLIENNITADDIIRLKSNGLI